MISKQTMMYGLMIKAIEMVCVIQLNDFIHLRTTNIYPEEIVIID